jgi:hypothetical protein
VLAVMQAAPRDDMRLAPPVLRAQIDRKERLGRRGHLARAQFSHGFRLRWSRLRTARAPAAIIPTVAFATASAPRAASWAVFRAIHPPTWRLSPATPSSGRHERLGGERGRPGLRREAPPGEREGAPQFRAGHGALDLGDRLRVAGHLLRRRVLGAHERRRVVGFDVARIEAIRRSLEGAAGPSLGSYSAGGSPVAASYIEHPSASAIRPSSNPYHSLVPAAILARRS